MAQEIRSSPNPLLLDGNKSVISGEEEEALEESSGSAYESSSTSYRGESSHSSQGNKPAADAGLGVMESKRVLRSKLIVLTQLAISAVCIAVAAYYFTTYSEEKDFEEKVRRVLKEHKM